MKAIVVILAITVLLIAGYGSMNALETTTTVQAQNLPKSLHGDASGMRWWYEQPDGFGACSGVAYDSTGCGTCHTKTETCESCHADAEGTFPVSQPDVCLVCHSRIGKERDVGFTDVHMDKLGMKCSNCHRTGDIHGNGTKYNTMFDKGAMDTSCTDCHETLPKNAEHSMHKDSLTCDTCHAKSVVTCYNCHFQTLLDSHQKKPAAAFKDFVILGNGSDGKVCAMSYQSVIYNGKGFAAFGPYHGHTITAEGRVCADCHDSPRMKELKEKGEIVMTWWDSDEGKVKHTTGVIPFVPDKFKFQFVNLVDGLWAPVDPSVIQMQHEFCTPLTEEQLKALGAE
jgi:hypothetical protein